MTKFTTSLYRAIDALGTVLLVILIIFVIAFSISYFLDGMVSLHKWWIEQ